MSPNTAGGRRRVQGELCAVRCGWVMLIVPVVATCPVHQFIVLAIARRRTSCGRRNVLPHTLQCQHPCRHHARAPFAGALPVCQCACTLQDSAGCWGTSSKLIGLQCYSSGSMVQTCADYKILHPHPSADSDHRSTSVSGGRCCLGSAVSL